MQMCIYHTSISTNNATIDNCTMRFKEIMYVHKKIIVVPRQFRQIVIKNLIYFQDSFLQMKYNVGILSFLCSYEGFSNNIVK
jgi:hypothetical protein